MTAEHCKMKGHDLEFTAPNYRITTTPKEEWNLVAERRGKDPEVFKKWLGNQKRKVGLGKRHHGRRIPDVDKLVELEASKKAELKDFEVIAIVLYTGPMVSLPSTRPTQAPRVCVYAICTYYHGANISIVLDCCTLRATVSVARFANLSSSFELGLVPAVECFHE